MQNAARGAEEVGGVKKWKIGSQDCSGMRLKARGELIGPTSSSQCVFSSSTRPASSPGALSSSASKEKHTTDSTPSLSSSADYPSHSTSPCPSLTSHWLPNTLALPSAPSKPLSSRNTASRTSALQSDVYDVRTGAAARSSDPTDFPALLHVQATLVQPTQKPSPVVRRVDSTPAPVAPATAPTPPSSAPSVPAPKATCTGSVLVPPSHLTSSGTDVERSAPLAAVFLRAAVFATMRSSRLTVALDAFTASAVAPGRHTFTVRGFTHERVRQRGKDPPDQMQHPTSSPCLHPFSTMSSIHLVPTAFRITVVIYLATAAFPHASRVPLGFKQASLALDAPCCSPSS
ncbi:hypothetical protein B0H13DRAFT_2036817 [Mycena leptocephala]|nr:hypothetical protein B0H13DRAFT_2099205 [Mycena leptocephala]KAJ7894106.1 hypothetical protein B0H13DRAFT_2036817 [Mycena leptocephala]